MSYIGRSSKLVRKAQEKVSFLATAGQTVKTGLSYTPTSVEVTVNGILLTDVTDYTASNGNSVTFLVALALNDEVTVVSLKTFTVADHYTISAANTLLAAKATNTAVALKAPIASPVFTGNVGIGVTPASGVRLDMRSNAAATISDMRNASATGYGLYIAAGSTSSQYALNVADYAHNSLLKVDSSGIVTKPYQPAFQVTSASMSGLATNTDVVIHYNGEIFDQSADFNTTTYTFTAPVAGKYQFNVQLLWVNWDSGASYYYLQLKTSNRTYYELYSGTERSADISYSYGHIHVLADMDAGDTAHVQILQSNGTAQTGVDTQSIFTGHLVA